MRQQHVERSIIEHYDEEYWCVKQEGVPSTDLISKIEDEEDREEFYFRLTIDLLHHTIIRIGIEEYSRKPEDYIVMACLRATLLLNDAMIEDPTKRGVH